MPIDRSWRFTFRRRQSKEKKKSGHGASAAAAADCARCYTLEEIKETEGEVSNRPPKRGSSSIYRPLSAPSNILTADLTADLTVDLTADLTVKLRSLNTKSHTFSDLCML
jgi:hypothetical protein